MMNRELTAEQLQAKKVMLWLLFECPMGGNPGDCLAHKLRLRGQEERRKLLDQMTGEELLSMYEAHKACLKRKELLRLVAARRQIGLPEDQFLQTNNP